MALTTKLQLFNGKFYQGSAVALDLSGTTSFGTVKYLEDVSGSYSARSLTDANYVTGLTENLQSQIDYVSGVTDTNTTNITNNYNDIVELSGLTINSITGATNGLTKDGRDVKLGGILTENATISGASSYDVIFGTNASQVNSFCSNAASSTYVGSFATDTNSGLMVDFCCTQLFNCYDDGISIAYSKMCMDRSDGVKLEFSGTSNTMFYADDYSSQFNVRSLPDVGYVTGITDMLLTITDFNSYSATTDTRLDNIEDDIIELSGVTSITGATNGLTKSGRDVELGGTLNSFTCIETPNNATLYIGETSGFTSYSQFTCDSFSSWHNDGSNDNVFLINQSISRIGYSEAANEGQQIYTCANDKIHLFNIPQGATKQSQIELRTDEIYFNAINTGGTNVGLYLRNGQLEYVADYSTNYTARSIPDVAYVTGQTGAIGADNGLARDGDNIVLGGSLTGDTTISGTNTLLISAPHEACDVQYFKFDSTPTISGHEEGRLHYSNCALNFEREISGVTLQLGEEEVIRVTNGTGSLIENGSVVYIDGSIGGVPSIDKSIASNDTALKTIGMATSDIADNSEGYVTVLGLVRNYNTSSWSAGDELYLSSTVAGELTNTPPTYPDDIIRVGIVSKVGTTDGEILVKIYWEADHVEYGLFTGYTATTQTEIDSKLDTSIFETYTGDTDTRITNVEEVTDVAITGATNGLTKVGDHDVKINGVLTEATSFTGAYSLTLSPTQSMVVRTLGDNAINIDAQSGGGVALKSQSGTNNNQTSFTNAIGIYADYDSAGGFAVYDNRTGSNQTGIIYASDYSTNYVNRSLVDKAYVDSVATGLQAKAAVDVATTGNVDLTGGTFTSGSTIDGQVVLDGWRILAKDQTDGTENGIWVFSGSSDTFYRAEDYNGTPSGEVSNGDLIPVISGDTHHSTQWILTTEDPITIGTTSLEFSLFSQLLQIDEGDGINLTNVSGTQVISVELSPTTPGLVFDGTGLELDYTIFSSGLTASGGEIQVNASTTPASGTEIPVRFGTNNDLFVDASDFQTLTASNGINITSSDIQLGGALATNTSISGVSGTYNLSFVELNSFNLGFDNVSTITDNGTNGGLRYAGDYSENYVCQSIPDVQYVHDSISGDTILTYNNGLTKQGDVISWGGTLTGDTFVSYGSGRICMLDGATSCVDMVSDCSTVHVENTSLYLRSCTNGTCNGTVTLSNTGTVAISTNNATTGITITDSGAGVGAVYGGDYSSTFVDRSLIDKAYVDTCVDSQTSGITTTAITGATNGLTKVGQDVCLGGTITTFNEILVQSGSTALYIGDTNNYQNYMTISNNNFIYDLNNSLGTPGHITAYSDSVGDNAYIDIGFTDGGFNEGQKLYFDDTNKRIELFNDNPDNSALSKIQLRDGELVLQTNNSGGTASTIMCISDGHAYFANNYCNNYTNRSIVDKEYVDGNISGITTNAITGATNGLTKSGQDVKLGGTLSETTTIDGAQTLDINISNFNVTGATDITGAVTMSSTLDVTGAIDGNSTLDILGATSLRSTLNVTGATTIGGELTLSTVNAGSISTDEVVVVDSGGIIKKVAADTLGEDNNRYSVTGVSNSTVNLNGSEYVVLVDTSLGSVTINLPTTPVVGTAVKIKDKGNALTNNITIDAGIGKSIDGSQTASINTDYGALELVYGESNNWYSLAFIN